MLGPDTPASVYILDVGGKRQVSGRHLTTADEDVAELQAVLDSIQIDA